MNQANDAKSEGNGLIAIAPIQVVASECHPDGTAVESIAPKPTKSGHNEPNNGTHNPPDVPSTNTKRDTAVTATCQQCGREMVARRPSKRFCNGRCRRAAWLVSNPEKAAELAAKDKERLRVHLETRGVAWVENAG
jgi:hypothetical protein